MIQKLDCQSKKCYKNLFFRHLEPPKEYGRVCHRYIGKVMKFGLYRIIICRSNCHFSVGGAENAPPLQVKLFNFQFMQIKLISPVRNMVSFKNYLKVFLHIACNRLNCFTEVKRVPIPFMNQFKLFWGVMPIS